MGHGQLDSRLRGGGAATSARREAGRSAVAPGRGIRCDRPASLEPTSGGRFGAFRRRLAELVLQQPAPAADRVAGRYLRRVRFCQSAVTLIPAMAPCQLPHQPVWQWRVERTTRLGNAIRGPQRAWPAGSSPPAAAVVPPATAFGAIPQLPTCAAGNNLIHRDAPCLACGLRNRADADCEFLASTGSWFAR